MHLKAFAVTLACTTALAVTPALAQTKVTNQGITPTEIVIGTHQDLSGPIKTWGVPVANGMKLAVEEINAAGGINGRKLKLIIEDSAYDPKKAVLASQKMIEKDKVFAMIGGMGSATGHRRPGHPVRRGRAAALPADRRRVHLQVRRRQAAGAAEVQQPPALCREHPRGREVHGRVEEACEALPDVPGRRVRQERARRLHPAARRHEAEARLDHDLQARRLRLQRPGRQDEVRRLRSGRAGHHPARDDRRHRRGQEDSAGTSPSSARRRPTFPTRSRSARTWSRACMPPAPSRLPMPTRPRARSRTGSRPTRRRSAPTPTRSRSSATTPS